MRKIRSLVPAIVLCLAVVQPAAAIGPGASGSHAPVYYLSLGDSLAAGEQPVGDGVTGHPTDEGYADQLYAMARAQNPNLKLVKLGCSGFENPTLGGESTATMITGGVCPYPHGSQLAEAVAFLHAHGKFVAFVTIDIGANDFPCQDSEACVAGGLASIGRNLPRILAELREAAGPTTPIVGATIYDPMLGYWLLGSDGQALATASVPVFVTIGGFLSSIYTAAGMRVADVQGAFSTTDFTPVPELGGMPLNVARICQWTWVCAPDPFGPNNHANAAGYGVIAQAFATALEAHP
jgi:lysophospholipase L1-like esterase